MAPYDLPVGSTVSDISDAAAARKSCGRDFPDNDRAKAGAAVSSIAA
jgi:hypothetical protein